MSVKSTSSDGALRQAGAGKDAQIGGDLLLEVGARPRLWCEDVRTPAVDGA